MLDRIRALFSDSIAENDESEAALHLAAAILFIEIAKSDQSIDDAEVLRLQSTLKRDWQLNDTEVDGLVDVARQTSDASESLQDHIDLINRNFSAERKFNLVRGLWQVACADGHIHQHEEQLIMRLAGLMQVSRAELTRCRHWALGSQAENGE
jgi:uncharacterized tellurite resistance protein B-like protein